MLQKTKDWIESTIKYLNTEYSKLQIGRANPSLLEDLMVEVYGVTWPLKNSASVSVMWPQTINIKPWDKSIVHNIEKAISESGLWFSPQNMWDSLIIKIPPLTQERRTEVVKIAKKLAEDAKISVRNARSESYKDVKKAEKDKEITEDDEKKFLDELQKLVDEANKKIDDFLKNKSIDIMKV